MTGDVGVLDSEGFLSLKGRAKELIKKGGEQVSPYEVEEILLDHPWVKLPVCFSVPSKVYGEEVGCAIVLNDGAPKDIKENEVIKSLRKWMKDKKFAPVVRFKFYFLHTFSREMLNSSHFYSSDL